MALGVFLGGLSFFLMGLKMVGAALKGMAGKKLREALTFLSSNPFLGFMAGLVVTGLSNSLTLVSVLLVQFVSAGVMPFEKSIPVLMGAGVGSTFIGLLVVLNVTKFGLGMFAAAYLIEILGGVKEAADGEDASGAWKVHTLRIIGGLGLLFHGSELMGRAFAFLHEDPESSKGIVASLSAILEYPVVGLFVGTAFTGVVQSSGAALGVYLSLAQQGVVTARVGIGLVLGANVGTCVTAVLAALGQGVGPLRVAMALTLARLIGGIVCCFCIEALQRVSEMVCGLDAGASSARLGTDPADHAAVIATAHTVFNVALAIVVVPLAGPYSRFICALVKDPNSQPGKKVDVRENASAQGDQGLAKDELMDV